MRKADIIKLCEKHYDCEFHAFTNGTLVDDAFCEEMQRVGNLSLSISLEGFEEVNDLRRGVGVYDKVMAAMDKLKSHGLIFGTSICYTSKNIETVTSDEFLDMIIEKGCRFTWYFHYMPVGNDAAVDLLPTKEQREYMYPWCYRRQTDLCHGFPERRRIRGWLYRWRKKLLSYQCQWRCGTVCIYPLLFCKYQRSVPVRSTETAVVYGLPGSSAI